MSLFRPFIEACATLGVTPEDDAAAVKRAYRKLALAHPPDTDPEGFRRVRDAYELLSDPGARVNELLLRPEPMVDPPPLPPPPEPPPPGALALLLLRLAAARVAAAELLPASAPAEAAAEPGSAEERRAAP